MMYVNGCRSNYNKCYDSYLILPTFVFLFFTLIGASIIPTLLWNGSILHISCLDNVHMGDLLNLFFQELVIKSKGEKQIYINYIFDQCKNVFIYHSTWYFQIEDSSQPGPALWGCWVSDGIEHQNFVDLIYHSNDHKR
jgi:hypothetical protein